MDIWFAIANRQILSNFDRVVCPGHDTDMVLSVHIFITIVVLKLFFLCHSLRLNVFVSFI